MKIELKGYPVKWIIIGAIVFAVVDGILMGCVNTVVAYIDKPGVHHANK